MVGRPVLRAEEGAIGDVELKDIMVGDEAAAVRQALEISYPVSNGIVQDWGDMEVLYDYIFNDKLHVDTSERRILLTEAPLNPVANRKRMLSLMFEKYQVQGAQISVQAMLTLYAQGVTSGVVVDSGDGVTHVVGVYEGFVPQHLTRRLNVAGRHLTQYLVKLLLLRGYTFNRTADFATIQEMKEKLCYCALDAQAERKLAEETTVLMQRYKLPDGREVKIGRERFETPEALFNPSLIDCESPGLSDMVFGMIQDADMDLRSSFYNHIVLSGGSTMYPGLPSRLQHDLSTMYKKKILKGEAGSGKVTINVESPPQRKHAVFTGAAVLAKAMASRGDEFWYSKARFEEEGIDRMLAK